MKKIFLIWTALMLSGAAISYAQFGVNDRGDAPCSWGVSGMAGSCHYFELYGNYDGPVAYNNEEFDAVGGNNFYMTYSSASQINIAIPVGLTASVVDYDYSCTTNGSCTNLPPIEMNLGG